MLVIKQGDVVCVHENSLPRQKWKLGTVQELIFGRDDLVCAAVVRLVSKGKVTEMKRPVQKLYPVEVFNEHADSDNKKDVATVQPAQLAIRFVPDDQVEIVRSARTFFEHRLITQSYY